MFTKKFICIVTSVLVTITLASTSLAQNVSLQAVDTNLDNPTSIANAGDGSGRLFITEQDGRILVYDNGSILSTPFLNISTLVDDGGSEEGLLGLAFHPNYPAD